MMMNWNAKFVLILLSYNQMERVLHKLVTQRLNTRLQMEIVNHVQKDVQDATCIWSKLSDVNSVILDIRCTLITYANQEILMESLVKVIYISLLERINVFVVLMNACPAIQKPNVQPVKISTL